MSERRAYLHYSGRYREAFPVAADAVGRSPLRRRRLFLLDSAGKQNSGLSMRIFVSLVEFELQYLKLEPAGNAQYLSSFMR